MTFFFQLFPSRHFARHIQACGFELYRHDYIRTGNVDRPKINISPVMYLEDTVKSAEVRG